MNQNSKMTINNVLINNIEYVPKTRIEKEIRTLEFDLKKAKDQIEILKIKIRSFGVEKRHEKSQKIKYRTSLDIALRIRETNKDFFLFNYDNNKIKDYKLTNNLSRYKNHYMKWALVENIKSEIRNLEIFF